ncbi:hypothetical protein HMN09_00303300 [Mycena chlorophos]|uniref:DUF7223 domain-containing protein n=1 Tax=Mycena chlorophos TaxID=658473 RepID=A0A8H6WPC3_MYCCL|nr:hypothetical protein HMN09_00303300 [Mycena chlorophos]
MLSTSSLLVLLPFIAGIRAANDWSVPCITGSCSYDLPTNGTASGTVTIWGATDAISDITTAAGWEILDCDSAAQSQTIRLVCTSANTTNCEHLYSSNGAVNKVVRLPETCGASAFARVALAYTPADQTLPSDIAARVVRRDGSQPVVRALQLDTNFLAVDYSQTGAINIALQAANTPGATSATPLNVVPPSRRSSRLSQRTLQGFVQNSIRALELDTNPVDINQNFTLTPLNFDKNIQLFNQSIDCSPVNAEVSANLDGNANAVATVGVAVSGTLVPPKFTDFAITTTLNGSIGGTLNLNAAASGSVDTGNITLINLPLAGIDFPGVLTIGPTFEVNVGLTSSLDLDLDLKVGINLNVDNAQIVFPPPQNTVESAFSIGDTPLTISASPNVQATGDVTVHLIPSLNFGISALDVATAQVFAAIDTSATLSLNLDGSLDASTTLFTGDDSSQSTTTMMDDSTTTTTSMMDDSTTTSTTMMDDSTTTSSTMMDDSTTSTMMDDSRTTSSTMMDDATRTSSMMDDATRTSTMMDDSTSTTTSMASRTTSMMDDGRRKKRDVSTAFSGSVELDAGIAVSVGAQGNLFNLFSDSADDTLFNKNFVIFKKNFGSGSSRRRSLLSWLGGGDNEANPRRAFGRRSLLSWREPTPAPRAVAIERRAGLSCPAAGLGSVASLVDQTVDASDITADA